MGYSNAVIQTINLNFRSKALAFIRENGLKEVDGKFVRQYEDVNFSKYTNKKILSLYSYIQKDIMMKLMWSRNHKLPDGYLDMLRQSQSLTRSLQVVLDSIKD